jgi:hypothetical protein
LPSDSDQSNVTILVPHDAHLFGRRQPLLREWFSGTFARLSWRGGQPGESPVRALAKPVCFDIIVAQEQM